MSNRRISLSMELDEAIPTSADIISHINSMVLEGKFITSSYLDTPQISVAGSIVVLNTHDDNFRELHDRIWDACMDTDFDGFSFSGISANEVLISVKGHKPELYLKEFTINFKGKNITISLTLVSKELYINT